MNNILFYGTRLEEIKQPQTGRGAAIIPSLPKNLRHEIPEIKGLSERNIGYKNNFGLGRAE